jgi:hypothetical protein
MSYILDALRKAERDRQVARIPTLATAHGGADLFRRSPWLWLAVSAGALALGGVVLYTWLAPPVRPDSAPPAQIAAPAPAAGAPPAADLATASPQALERTEPVPALERAPGARGASAPSVAPVVPPTSSAPVPADVPKGPSRVSPAAPGPRVQAPAPPVFAPPAPGPRVQAQAPPVPVAPAPTAPAPTSPAPPAPVPAAPAPSSQAPPAQPAPLSQAPPLRQTPQVQGAPAPPGGSDPPVESRPGVDPTAPPAGLPPRPGTDPGTAEGAPPAGVPVPARMSLDVLVYSEVPAERLVFINGKKYVEGQTVDGDAVLEQITQDGAVLRQQGQRIVLRPKLNPYAPRPGSP